MKNEAKWAEEIRHASDYDDFYIASKEKAAEQVETAEYVLEEVEKYLKGKIME